MTIVQKLVSAVCCGLLVVFAPAAARAQAAPSSTDQRLEQRIDELTETIKSLNARIEKLEGKHARTAKPHKTRSAAISQPPQDTTDSVASNVDQPVDLSTEEQVARIPTEEQPEETSDTEADTWGAYEPGKGFVAVRGKEGELDVGLIAYLRYLNQLPLKSTYTDSFGRVFHLDLRQDVLLNKVNLSFKGWLFDPKFEYRVWIWTQNPAMGDPAQVVVGGHLGYHFADFFNVFGGVAPLPTTRSTNWTYPFWLKMDNRTIADEFFRGSYTFGFWANGDITDDLQYRAMIANNLSALGINANQLPATFSTYSAALWWMPTTGEFGTGLGFGDYDFHEKPATLFGVHYTQSPETAQAQPNVNSFENTQIRLSDGTLLFSNDAFNTNGSVEKADYHMLDLNAGVKYLGFSLETEAYMRWVDNFETIGFVPVSSLFDKGFQIQASAMAVPKVLQVYAAGSQIFGQYGDPYDLTLGLNWYPFSRREMHINTEAIYLWRSPVGGQSYPYIVGGTGWLVNTDFIVTF